MMKPITASERAAAKAAGIDAPRHPADAYRDPPYATLADQHDAQATAKSPRLKHLGGSNSDAFNIAIAEATRHTAWITSEGDADAALANVGTALAGIAPTDEIEGMLAAQMVAAHQASMECFRRAMIVDQTVEGRAMNLKFATKASATYAQLLDALNRHRGKGNQKVTVEHVHRHVHVYDDGQAIAGHLGEPGGGGSTKSEEQPDAPRLAHAPADVAPVWREDAIREPLPVSGDAEWAVPDARGREPRRAKRAG